MWVVKLSLLLGIIFSLGVCFIQPKMHTQFLVYNSDYVIEETKPVVQETKSEPVQIQTVKETKVTKPVQNAQKQVKTQQTTQKQSQKQTQTKKQTQTTKQETKPTVKTTVQQTAKPQTTKTVQQQVQQKTKPLTKQEQEEIIAWNKWHSDLQNSIMRDTKLPIVPDGTRFNFTFTVDKFGKVSDIKTWSDNPSFNIYAVQYIAPVIKGYQGKSILNFPVNSQRTTTKFIGKFKISTRGQNVYSSASDYNDMEKIRK